MKLKSINSKALGSIWTGTPYVVKCAITADASSGLTFALGTADEKYEIIDIVAISTATVASATATVSDGTNDISDAIDIDTVDVVSRAGTIDTTYSTLAENSTITITTASSSDRAVVYVYCLRQ